MDKEKDDSRVLEEYTMKFNKKTLHIKIIDPRTRYTPEQLKQNEKEFYCAVELALNDSVYKDGYISKQMYEKAKDMILKDYK